MTLHKPFFLFLFLVFYTFLNAQNFSDSWNEHFSYLDIKCFSESETKIYVAAENAIFSYDKLTNQTITVSTIQGLSGDNITTIKYIASKNKLYIGYDTGLIQIYDEIDNNTLSVVDILDKPTILPDKKRINDFNLFEGRIYISADFGISVFFTEAEEFGDTYFIGANNSQIKVNQTSIFNGYLYAATEINFRRGLLTNSNLIDSNQWETGDLGGNWVKIVANNNGLYAARDKIFHKIDELKSNTLFTLPELIEDLTNYQDKLAITTRKRVRVYNENVSLTAEFRTVNYKKTVFSNAIVSDNGIVYIGTSPLQVFGRESYGVLKSNISTPEVFQEIHPECPLLNRFFKIESQGGHVWGTHGGYSLSYGFSGGIRRTGISHLINKEWKNITYDSIKADIKKPDYLTHLSINPFNSNRIMLSSYWFGVIEIEGGKIIEKYNNENSSLKPLSSTVHYTLASTYTDNGTFWVLNGRVKESLNKFQNGVWTGISTNSIINPPDSNLGYGEIAIDNSGNLFMGSHGYGLMSYSAGVFNNISGIGNNMPSNSVRTIKVDKNNQVWFGTTKGLRVVFNPEEFANGNPVAEEIIILDNGEASELLFQQFITDIEVDGSNNKWIATLDNGLFYFTSDGQRTIFHFTKDNSPLPSNDVLDVSIEENSGRVYIATEKGLVSFESKTTKPEATLVEAYAYPNPVRPGFNLAEEKVKIIGLTENMNIKIVDIEGNLVAEAEAKKNTRFKGFNLEIDGGTALWNGKNMSGNTVASGVYVVLLNNLETFETKVLKIMIVR